MSLKEISLAEVKEHCNRNSPWIVINNDIYDVTAFLNDHPGGEEVLLEQAGKVGTEAFEDVGHSSDARELMVKYKIGTLPTTERSKEVPKKVGASGDWSSDTSSNENSSSFGSWIVPVVLGLVATAVYRFYFSS